MRKIDEERFLYSVGEESIMKTWNKEDVEVHEFSAAYKSFREELIRKAGEEQDTGAGLDAAANREIISMPQPKTKKKWYRRPAGIAAAVVAAVLLSVGAYAISGLLRIKSQEYTGDWGQYTYEFEADEGVMVQPMRLVPNYLPEGYEYAQEHYSESDGIKKYQKEDGTGGLTLALDNYNASLTFPYVSSVENTEINGVKTDILTRNGDVPFNHILLMFYEDLGQIVTIYGHRDLSLEELKKIAENLELEPTGGEPYEPLTQERETCVLEPVLIAEGRRVEIGEVMEYKSEIANVNMTYKVTDIEIRDELSGLSEKYFASYEDAMALLDEDGKLGSYEKTESVWENNELVEKSLGEGHYGFAYVTLEITNMSDERAEDQFVWAKMAYENQETGEEESEPMFETIYYDGSDYADGEYNKHLFASDFEAGETKTVHLGLIFVKERQDEAYLSFFGWTNVIDTCYVKLIP